MVMAVEPRFMTRVNMRYLEMSGKSRLVGGRNFSTMRTRKTISDSRREIPNVSFSCILQIKLEIQIFSLLHYRVGLVV